MKWSKSAKRSAAVVCLAGGVVAGCGADKSKPVEPTQRESFLQAVAWRDVQEKVEPLSTADNEWACPRTHGMKILYADKHHAVKALPNATPDDFADLYAVLADASKVNLTGMAERVCCGQDQPTILRVRPSQLGRLLAELQKISSGCAPLVKLPSAPFEQVEPGSLTPVYPVDKPRDEVRQVACHLDVEKNVRMTVDELSKWNNRHAGSDTGRKASEQLQHWYETAAGQRNKRDVEVVPKNHNFSDVKQPSVIITIHGTAPAADRHRVLLGAHIDSINELDSGDQEARKAPGADDDASGIAIGLEIFRALMAAGVTFERTVEIHAYAAEEFGLWGSGQIANEHLAPNDIEAMLQLDMSFYSAKNDEKVWVARGSEQCTDPDLSAAVFSLGKIYTGPGAGWVTVPVKGFGTSDHRAFGLKGFRTAWLFEEEPNPRIHTADDTSEGGRWNAKFVKNNTLVTLAYLMHFAGGHPQSACPK
ncbi:MAG: M20/M25/M40 family metallo-hydrolase [Polyangiaceae bacterium]|nr:M20/M25/M40 family metallo-hydrolase [Polyangiaceae bacterium]